MGDDGIEQQIAEFVCGLAERELPDDLVHAVERCILDYLGVGIRGAQHETVRLLDAWITAQGDSEQARMLGSGKRCSAANAALHNGVASHVLDFDDTHIPTILHPSSPVCSALLPAAQRSHATGREVLSAYVAGYEVSARIARALFPSHYDHGWHMTGTAGVLGAAAAVAALHRLSPEQCVCALGLAATMASGLRENFGSMAKSLHAGNAARNGLFAAELAALGYTASPLALSAPRGFLPVMAEHSNPQLIVDGLGEQFEVLERHSVKPFPCGVVLHPVLDAVCQLRRRIAPPQGEEVTALVATVNPYVLELTGKTDPQSGLEGKFSIYYTLAVGFLRGTVTVDDFSDQAVRDAAVRAWMPKVQVEVDAQRPVSHAHLAVIYRDGHREELTIEGSKGMPESPLSDAALRDKFAGLVTPVLGNSAAARIEQSIMSLPEERDFADVLDLCCPGGK